MPPSSPRPDKIHFPAALTLAAMIEQSVMQNAGLFAGTAAEGSPPDPSNLAPHALIAAGAMAILQKIEPDNPQGRDPVAATEALFRRKGLQRRVREALPSLILPEPFRRVSELHEKAQAGSIDIGSLNAGEELTLVYSTRRGKESRLVVARDNDSSDDTKNLSVVISEASGRTINSGVIVARLRQGEVVWLGYTAGRLFGHSLVRGTQPSWDKAIKYDRKRKRWTYPNIRTDSKTTLRQVYYGKGTEIALF